jgi:hypothetical protein
MEYTNATITKIFKPKDVEDNVVGGWPKSEDVVVTEAEPKGWLFVTDLLTIPKSEELVTDGLLKENAGAALETFPNKDPVCCCKGWPKTAIINKK